MQTPKFDADGIDRTTFAPFELQDARSSDWQDVRLSFAAWDWLAKQFGQDVGELVVDDYYFNGYGVEGLVKACLLNAGRDPEADGIDYDSEGDTCYVHFKSLDDAAETARLASQMMHDRATLATMIAIARESGFDDA